MNADELVHFMDDYYRMAVHMAEWKIVGAQLDDPSAPTKMLVQYANGRKLEHPFPDNAPMVLRLKIWEAWAQMKGFK